MDLGTGDSYDEAISPRSCDICKKLKKKCDKKLPSCSRCIRVHATCDYGQIMTGHPISQKLDAVLSHLCRIEEKLTPTQSSGGLFESYGESTIERTRYTGVVPPPSGRAGHSDVNESHKSALALLPNSYSWAMNPRMMTPSYLKIVFTANLACILEDVGLSMDQAIHVYIETIHRWLPMMDHTAVLERIHMHRDSQPLPAYDSLLLLTIYLAVSSEALRSATPQTAAYLTCKQQFTILQSMDEDHMTLQLVQSGILIAIYEYGHGLLEKAYTTLGICVRMVSFLQLQRYFDSDLDGDLEALQEHKVRTWWAIMILDRNVSSALGRPEALPAMLTISQQNEQRMPSIELDRGSHGNSLLRTIESTCDMDFRQECRATNLLDRVLNITLKKSPGVGLPGIDDIIAMDHHLQNFLLELKISHNNQISLCTGGLTSCLAASLILHSFYESEFQNESVSINDVIGTSARMTECVCLIADLARDWSKEPEQFVPPTVINVVFRAAKVISSVPLESPQHCLFQATPAYGVKEELVTILQKMSSRWRLAGKYSSALSQL